jgi:15-cis-phytoene synthase
VGRNTSFYYSFLTLSSDRRNAIIAVWDFCRAVDDAVDELPALVAGTSGIQAEVTKELQRWRGELDACYEGREPMTEQGRRLQPVLSSFPLPRSAFDDVIDGVSMDVEPRRYESFEELYEYCLRVASAVGLLCIEIFGCRNPGSKQYALDLGVALQLTNIVRDVAVDLTRGRVYIPQEDLRRFGCTENDLRGGLSAPQVKDLLRFQCDRAREYYERARRLMPPEEGCNLKAARIMGEIYFDLLQRIERCGYDVFSRVVTVPRYRRAAIAAAVWAKSRVGY